MVQYGVPLLRHTSTAVVLWCVGWCVVCRFVQFGDSSYVTDFSYHLASRFYEAYSIHSLCSQECVTKNTSFCWKGMEDV